MRVSAKGKLSAVLRNLCNHGVEALKPQLIKNSKTRRKTHWNPPAVSKRAANVIRKQAIQQGTYGSFDSTTGIGWDPKWDIELANTNGNGHNGYINSGRYNIRPSKTTKRVRTREQRAQKIEQNMKTMDEKIDQYYTEKSEQKPIKDFEYYYKKHTRK